ncbi:MAG: DUF1559 domain-containing protein [Planctomycetaceae bacterium]
MSHASRRGITWLEVVVVVFIIAVLITLLMPAIQRQRNGPRRNQCLNNMKNLTLAVANFQTTKGGTLPLLEDGRHGWPVALLPYLDQPRLVRGIQTPGWTDKNAPYLEVFTCRHDEDSFQAPGGLSYVANAGYGFFPVDPRTGAVTETGTHSLAQDWNGDGEISEDDRLMTRATGVVWRKDEIVPTLTIDDIGAADGAGSTLLFLENLHAGPWTSRDARAIAFVVDRDRLTFASEILPFALNGANDSERTGPFPAPSSGHGQTVQAAFADGRVSSLNDMIDPLVFLRLMTPQGSLYGQKSLGDAEY